MNEYVLVQKEKGLFADEGFYAGQWNDTPHLAQAKRYTLDDAMEEASCLKDFGGHYRVVRVENDRLMG